MKKAESYSSFYSRLLIVMGMAVLSLTQPLFLSTDRQAEPIAQEQEGESKQAEQDDTRQFWVAQSPQSIAPSFQLISLPYFVVEEFSFPLTNFSFSLANFLLTQEDSHFKILFRFIISPNAP